VKLTTHLYLTEVRNAWSYTPTPQYVFMVWCFVKHRDNFPFPFIFSSYKKLKIKICRTVIFPFVLYGCKTWSLTLREKHRLKVFENSADLKGRKTNRGENCIMMNVMACILHLILLE
jgi:hypothetical protein